MKPTFTQLAGFIFIMGVLGAIVGAADYAMHHPQPMTPADVYSNCLHINIGEPESIQPQIQEQCALLANQK